MLYLAIPAHNEVATIGVLLWRLRTVLAEFPREYEVVVYDDASTDETAAVAEQYERAMPVTVLRGGTRLGYAGAVDALLRHVAGRTRYPRRDAVMLMQGDFTDPPVVVPEFARRFEGGADLVVGERLTVADAPVAVKRLFKYGHWVMRPFVKVQGVADLTASMRLVRISALREAIGVAGTAPLVSGDSWTANADLLLRLAPHARRVESVPLEPTFGVRMRETRRVAMSDTLAALKWAWGARGRRAVVGSSPAEGAPEERRGSAARQQQRRRDEPELSVERLREKVRERDGTRGLDGEPQDQRRGRRRKERPDQGDSAERPNARAASERTERPERLERPERTERQERSARAPRERERGRARPERAATELTGSDVRPEGRAPAEPRDSRPPRRREETRSPFEDPTLELADPFAPPAPRREPRSLDRNAGGTTAAPSSEAADGAIEPAAAARAMPEDESRNAGTTASPAGAVAAASALSAEEAVAPAVGDPSTAKRPLPSVESLAHVLSPDEADAEAEVEGADGEDEGEDGVGPGDIGPDGEPKRKRRRNRRSRRGRRKKGAAGEEANGDGTADESATGERVADDTAVGDDMAGDESANGGEDREERAATELGGRAARRVRFTPADHIDGEPVLAEHDADGDEGDDDEDAEGGVESMSEGAPRPRRRGRRGRRGGARRSRGRKEKPEDTTDGAD